MSDHLSGPDVAIRDQAVSEHITCYVLGPLHRIGVFHRASLPARAVGSYPTLFILAASAPRRVGGMVSVTLSRSPALRAGITNY